MTKDEIVTILHAYAEEIKKLKDAYRWHSAKDEPPPPKWRILRCTKHSVRHSCCSDTLLCFRFPSRR